MFHSGDGVLVRHSALLEWLPSSHYTKKSWLMECCWDGRLPGSFCHLYRVFWSTVRVTIRLLVTSLEKWPSYPFIFLFNSTINCAMRESLHICIKIGIWSSQVSCWWMEMFCNKDHLVAICSLMLDKHHSLILGSFYSALHVVSHTHSEFLSNSSKTMLFDPLVNASLAYL